MRHYTPEEIADAHANMQGSVATDQAEEQHAAKARKKQAKRQREWARIFEAGATAQINFDAAVNLYNLGITKEQPFWGTGKFANPYEEP